MKRLAILGLLLLAPSAWAAPFLVCDPPPVGEEVTSYSVTDGANVVTTPSPLHWDMAGVANGAHTLQVRACNVWGCSDPTPFAFTRGVPGVGKGVRINAT